MFQRALKAFALLSATTSMAMLPPTTASAAVVIRYVSVTGSNANPCTLAQPCRALQRAINKTPARSEVHILDSGFYGNNASINRSITIVGNGHTVSLGVPITIDGANAVVTIRNLTLAGGANSTRRHQD